MKVTQLSEGILYTSLPCSGHASSAIQHQPAELLIISPDSPGQFLQLALTKACPQKASELTSQAFTTTDTCTKQQEKYHGGGLVPEETEHCRKVTFISLPRFYISG